MNYRWAKFLIAYDSWSRHLCAEQSPFYTDVTCQRRWNHWGRHAWAHDDSGLRLSFLWLK